MMAYFTEEYCSSHAFNHKNKTFPYLIEREYKMEFIFNDLKELAAFIFDCGYVEDVYGIRIIKAGTSDPLRLKAIWTYSQNNIGEQLEMAEFMDNEKEVNRLNTYIENNPVKVLYCNYSHAGILGDTCPGETDNYGISRYLHELLGQLEQTKQDSAKGCQDGSLQDILNNMYKPRDYRRPMEEKMTAALYDNLILSPF